MPEFRVNKLSFQNYGPFSFTLGAGQCMSIRGPSGGGKSLLLRALADLDPHQGNIFLDEIEHQSISASHWRRQVSLLPANPAWWHDTVKDHFEQNPNEKLLTELGFGPEVLDWAVDRLSTGEQQRLALLRLLNHNPKALLLDEATANLDKQNMLSMERLVLQYAQTAESPLIWVTHDDEQAQRVATIHYELSETGLNPLQP